LVIKAILKALKGKKEDTFTDEDRKISHTVRNLKKEIAEMDKLLIRKDERVLSLEIELAEYRENKTQEMWVNIASKFLGIELPKEQPINVTATNPIIDDVLIKSYLRKIPKDQLENVKKLDDTIIISFIKTNLGWDDASSKRALEILKNNEF